MLEELGRADEAEQWYARAERAEDALDEVDAEDDLIEVIEEDLITEKPVDDTPLEEGADDGSRKNAAEPVRAVEHDHVDD